MVYVSQDGVVHNKQPWGLSKIIGLFYGIISFVVFFFKSLIGMDTSSRDSSSSGWGIGFRGSGGGGGGRPFGPGGGGGGPSKRIRTMRDVNPPTANAGGCPGGACGMEYQSEGFQKENIVSQMDVEQPTTAEEKGRIIPRMGFEPSRTVLNVTRALNL